ncbi:DUF1353 domain-containing protein [Campylobacter canadensis]|uniref:DUF1353 domain-containing protein n=1 Tax=Campylobacter canadensis TaxID=449520 RepID=UPI001556F8FB|nr:DUF1353 domain-containing protein [Campylobacter canadensis]MBZ7995163.1 DUF1353 domain-containing protein [Campylobacter canadensis]MBZ8000527.1 DUF1353 domain-containing protein [Campylobacter canadensis]MBZ8003838.1 DUF1353 domain-containing protein [Campylobacter canadensis]
MKRVIIKPICKDKFELVQEYIYQSKKGSICVPSGYKTNGANIPRFLWSFYPPNSPEYLSAVIIHDYLCDIARKKKSYVFYKEADKVFYEALLELEVSKSKAKIFYFACSFFHWIKKCLKIIQ